MGRALRCRNAWIARRRFGGRRGRFPFAAPMVRNKLRAITLLLNLLMSRTMSDSTGLRCVADQFRADRRRAFARRAVERAARLFPQREETAREKRRVIERGDVDRARAAAQRIVADERRLHKAARAFAHAWRRRGSVARARAARHRAIRCRSAVARVAAARRSPRCRRTSASA